MNECEKKQKEAKSLGYAEETFLIFLNITQHKYYFLRKSLESVGKKSLNLNKNYQASCFTKKKFNYFGENMSR